ncbi:MAG: hypothetical protein JJU29_11145 [Verrucomicrobia bacterium]|nr:hypothetical protein [Verrucomicrobiota bacterium]MCH8512813.1 hypothetical protein [Kiritimatiellia bacterium]
MKATFDIPEDLYRSAKARSALEGRTLRAVVIELFQNWMCNEPDPPVQMPEAPGPEELAEFPWLAISQKYIKPGISSEMEDIRVSIARGWATETNENLSKNDAK